MNKKNLLFINSSLSGGGSERVMTLLANQFSEMDYNVTMLLVRKTKRDTYSISNKISIIRFNYLLKNKIYKLIKRIFLIRKYIKYTQADCVISFMSDINLCTLIAGIGLKRHILVSERANPAKSGRSKFQVFLEKKLYPKAHKVILQTEDVKKQFIEEIQLKSVVIPNPVNANIPKQYLYEREKRIVAAGRLTEQKNFSMLINSFNKFYKKYPEYCLEIYGEGPLYNELKQQICDLKLEKKARLMGFSNDVNEKMKKAEMFISTSDYEGISNSMIEALAMGIPTICTDCPVGGAKMMIKNNENGILIPVGDEVALYNAMEEIVQDKEFSRKISSNAVKIREEYSIERIANKWEAIL